MHQDSSSSRLRRRTRSLLAATGALAATAAVIAVPAFGTATSAGAASPRPCDIFAAGGTPCEAAYSTTRALFASYNGPLYQIQRASDGRTLNIGLAWRGGLVNPAPQASFCSGTTCIITKLYDQTANHNDMPISPATSCSGCSHGIAGPGPNGSDIGAPAMALPVKIGGHRAYGVLFDAQGTGYRIDNAKNVPTGSQPEGAYMLASSNLTSGSCCFDFGSAETNNTDDGDSTMNAIYYGTDCWTQNCTGPGPWVGGDLENGMYFSDTGNNPRKIASEKATFLSAWEKNNGTTNFTLKYGNGHKRGLIQSYSGPLPNGYNPMKVQNSIELGTGGDNSIWGDGEFFEGAVTAGYPSNATQNAVQASIVAAGYADNTTFVPTTATVVSLKAHANGHYVDAANSSTALIANATSVATAETFDLVTHPNGTVSLRAHSDGKYVDAQNGGTSPLIASHAFIGPWETFDLIRNANGTVSFRAHANGKYVDAQNGGTSPLIANRATIGPSEEFSIIRETVTISLRAHANGDYVTADNAGTSPLIANRTTIGTWETFNLISNANGSVSLRAQANGKYVDAANSTTALIANATSIATAETFDLVDNPDGSISLRARSDGDYVTADNAGASPLIANRTVVGPWEEFDLFYH